MLPDKFIKFLQEGRMMLKIQCLQNLPYENLLSEVWYISIETKFIWNNQRFARGISLERKGMREQLNAVMVRRLKSDLKGWDGAPRFPDRKLEAIEVSYSAQEREVHRLLQAYTSSRLAHTNAENETEYFASEFVLKLLKKRLFSSPQAFAIMLKQHEETQLQVKQ
jgi:hypothetical protein